MKRRAKPSFITTQISLQRRGVIRFAEAHNAEDAARIAVREARQGWTAEVQTYARSGGVVGRKTVHMTCRPATHAKGKPFVKCDIKPAFKKKIRRLS